MTAERHPNLQGGGAKNLIFLELASWVDCFRKGCWRRTQIGIMISFFQQVSFFFALDTASPLLIKTDTEPVRGNQCPDLLLS